MHKEHRMCRHLAPLKMMSKCRTAHSQEFVYVFCFAFYRVKLTMFLNIGLLILNVRQLAPWTISPRQLAP